MTNKKMWSGMLVITLVSGMAVLSACGSSDYARLKEPLLPDAQTAVVYFIGYNDDCGVVWDEETPVGDFDESGASNIVWRTTPGSHYFILSGGFNYIVVRSDLEPNKSYYVNIWTISNPIPFASDLIAVRVLKPEDGEKWVKRVKTVSFTDKWRAEFLKDEEDDLKEAKERLKEAKGKSLSIDLKGSDGR